ncbi:MAG: DUF1579 family protein [candidate division Zixibacteria bacterium]|nr:DUF1579 family protein [candidate division Zixibacteria bacterium]
MKLRIGMIVLLMGLLTAVTILASDTPEQTAGAEQPQWGPPPELKQMDGFIGDWTYTGRMLTDPADTNWIEHTADVTYRYVAGGGAIMMEFTGEMMGMEMAGLSIITYDRERKEWQQMWVDGFVGRQSYYTGRFTSDGKQVVSGVDLMNGQEFQTRIIISDITSDRFTWIMENSMDGRNWFVSMEGEYTRK